MDLRGVGIMSASQAYGYLQEASKVGQNYYPERMGKHLCRYLLTVRKILPHQCAVGIRDRLVGNQKMARSSYRRKDFNPWLKLSVSLVTANPS